MDGPERIIARIDYDGDVDGQWIDADAPRPHSFGVYFTEYIRADRHEAIALAAEELANAVWAWDTAVKNDEGGADEAERMIAALLTYREAVEGQP